MSSDKPDQNKLRHELNYNYHPVVISFDIKHIMLITNTIYCVESLFNICKTPPLRFFHH